MKDNFRILIGTLFSGENEIRECTDSIKEQTYLEWDHKIFSYLPNKKAHDTLYRFFMNKAEDFDIFLKVDADMVFMHKYCLSYIVDLFKNNSDSDHFQIAILDWYSNSFIIGLHAYRSSVKWVLNKENIFVDTPPKGDNKRIDIWLKTNPLVIHNPNPSCFQAYRFGVHRALKVLQPKLFFFKKSQFYSQLELLHKVWGNFLVKDDRRIGFASLGAYSVFNQLVTHEMYDCTNHHLKDLFKERYEHLTSEELKKLLHTFWSNKNETNRFLTKKVFLKKNVFSKLKFLRAIIK
ncbi:hypothetical protein ACFL0H_01340 [Thermodesulfobacteriota bacterium]